MTKIQETIIFTLAHKGAEVTASIEYNGADDEGNLTFQHPRTGADCGRVEGILEGWTERDPDAQKEWAELVTLAKDFCDGELYWKVENGGRYEL